jgi:hypothetical protein
MPAGTVFNVLNTKTRTQVSEDSVLTPEALRRSKAGITILSPSYLLTVYCSVSTIVL